MPRLAHRAETVYCLKHGPTLAEALSPSISKRFGKSVGRDASHNLALTAQLGWIVSLAMLLSPQSRILFFCPESNSGVMESCVMLVMKPHRYCSELPRSDRIRSMLPWCC